MFPSSGAPSLTAICVIAVLSASTEVGQRVTATATPGGTSCRDMGASCTVMSVRTAACACCAATMGRAAGNASGSGLSGTASTDRNVAEDKKERAGVGMTPARSSLGDEQGRKKMTYVD